MKKKYTYTAIIIVIALLITGFVMGYRIDDFAIKKSGVVNLTLPYKNSTIYVDNKKYKTSKEDNQEIAVSPLSEGSHTIVVGIDGKWPWTKKVTTPYGSIQNFSAWNLEQTPEVKFIEKNSLGYDEKITNINAYKLPTSASVITSDNEKISIYVENNAIMARWNDNAESAPSIFCIDSHNCNRTASIINLAKEVKQLFFYPGTDDRIIFVTEGAVSALDISEIGNQNYQYIMLGIKPMIYLNENIMFILDGEALGEITLK